MGAQHTALTQVAVERARRGDDKALRYLYAQYRNDVCADPADIEAIRDAIATLSAEQRETAFLRHVVGALVPKQRRMPRARRRRARLVVV